MLQVKMPMDFTKYRERFIAGLSLKQLGWSVLGAGLGSGIYLLSNKVLNVSDEITNYLTILAVLPCFGMGFVNIDGLNFMQWATIHLKSTFIDQKYFYKVELQDLPTEITEYRNICEERQNIKTFNDKGDNIDVHSEESSSAPKKKRGSKSGGIEATEITKKEVKRRKKGFAAERKAKIREFEKGAAEKGKKAKKRAIFS